jgi:hypothetical protein
MNMKTSSIVVASAVGLTIYSSALVHFASQPATPDSASASTKQRPPRSSKPHPTRTRPAQTFDLESSDPVAPGQTISLIANLPRGWAATQAPRLVPDPDTAIVVPTFQLVSSGATTDADKGSRYSVTVKNTGIAPMRFIADVPCSGCP